MKIVREDRSTVSTVESVIAEHDRESTAALKNGDFVDESTE